MANLTTEASTILYMTYEEKMERRIILKLIKLRKQKSISINQLAQETGVSYATIFRIENFLVQPSLITILKIARALDVSLTLDDLSKDCETTSDTISYNNDILINFYKDVHENIFLNSNADTNFLLFMEDIFEKISDITSKYCLNSAIKYDIVKFKKYASITFMNFCSGQHNLAYSIFKETIKNYVNLNLFIHELPNDLVLYRCRTFETNELFEFDSMFHIPFSKRYKVTPQRYSYPGLPCLYLGSTPEVCALEVGCNLNKLAIAQFKYTSNKKYKILDLTKIFDMSLYGIEEIIRNLPLVLLCSLHFNYKETNKWGFRQEYIFPQLLLEYILNETMLDDVKVIGIKYYSTRIDFIEKFIYGENDTLEKMTNYVFPAREISRNTEHCSLLKKAFKLISITQP